ncbi:PepSY domain-containing protein [Ruminococcaceae bacterium OttesenSCG-928-L11]|nr:PepSY domain-containing protein [Ruminococcaceae bacterium OttesenSCG-928-L11]
MNKQATLKQAGTTILMLILTTAMLVGLAMPAAAATYIGQAKAKTIALESAGLQASDVTVVKSVRYDKKHTEQYGIIFLTYTTKYFYEIDAVSGDILSHYTKTINRNSNKQTNTTTTDKESYIGREKAKSIALIHAGVSESNVRKYECDLDRDDGRMIYEIEFKAGGMEYEYEIDALTGDILDWESERD